MVRNTWSEANLSIKEQKLLELVEGITYQTLVLSIIHKYVSGSLQDITANK